jgi:hypothetical protein
MGLAGGILTPGWPVRAALEAHLLAQAPRVSIVTDAVDAPRGALAMAARLRG